MIHNKCLKLSSHEAMFEKQGVSRGGCFIKDRRKAIFWTLDDSLFGPFIWSLYLDTLFGRFFWTLYLDALFGRFILTLYFDALF